MTGTVAAHGVAPSADTSPALELREVSKSFGGLHVLKSVSFSVPPATIYGVAGPNGAGKTTLLNLITGFGSATSGQMLVDGTDATGLDTRRITSLGVARTFQNIRLFRGLTVRQQVEAGAYRHRKASLLQSALFLPVDRRDRKRIRSSAEEILSFVGLADHADRLAETLSYGDQRRLEIARAMATQPSLLLLDEPTAGMNDADWMPLADLLGRLRDNGTSIVVVEHNMRLLERSCDRVVVIAAGGVIAEDEPVHCLRLPQVRLAYFGR